MGKIYMGKFSYALEFYKANIFNIDTDEDIEKFKIAVEDAITIEEHFPSVLNIDLLRENIIISFYFNKDLNVDDRINYIRGIVYSRRYINYRDIFSYYELLEKYSLARIETSIYEEKDEKQKIDGDFFAEAFYENLKTSYEIVLYQNKNNKNISSYNNLDDKCCYTIDVKHFYI